MSIAQSTTVKFPPVGQEGQKLSHPAEVVSPKIVDEATGLLPGRVVVRGTNPDREVALVAPGDVVADAVEDGGIVNLDLTEENVFVSGKAETVEAFADGEEVAVSYRGRVYVISEDAATAGGLVYVRVSGVGDVGALRATDDAGDAAVLTGWKFATSTTAAGELAVIERF